LRDNLLTAVTEPNGAKWAPKIEHGEWIMTNREKRETVVSSSRNGNVGGDPQLVDFLPVSQGCLQLKRRKR